MNTNRLLQRIRAAVFASLIVSAPGLLGCTGTSRTLVAPIVDTRQEAATTALSERLDAILHRLDDEGATVSARVLELPSGRELYSVEADNPRIPASNMKLPVSAAGLDMFGPDHRVKTYLAYDGENLWLIGAGDPAVGDSKIAASHGRTTLTVFEEWAKALRGRGVNRIPGHLYYYPWAFERRRIHPSWHVSDLVHWYAAPVSGLNFNDNCVDITAHPTEPGQPVDLTVMPPARHISVVNQCVTGSDGSATISRDANANVYRIEGQCNEPTSLKSKPVTDPGLFFADALRTHLAGEGITIQGELIDAGLPLDGAIPPKPEHLVAVHETRMSDILWRINKSSQNLFAECLCKLTGRNYATRKAGHVSSASTSGTALLIPGSWENGEEAVRAFLHAHDIDDTGFELADGSGLSRDNRVTVRLISDLLATMFRHPHSEAFRASLSVGGQDGTLSRRLKDISGRVRAKTGYISGVRALSGYIHTEQDQWLCFSIIYNDIPGSVKPYEELQDEVCRLLYHWPDLPDEPSSDEPQPEAAEEVAIAGTAGVSPHGAAELCAAPAG